MDPFVAEIRIFAFNFAPKGWAFCDGQILPLSQNTALFSLLGTTYGGDGRTTFKLPDLRSRVAVGVGKDRVQVDWAQGQADGEESLVLTSFQISAHSHTLMAAAAADTASNTTLPSAAVGLGQTVGTDDQSKPITVLAYVADATPAAALHSSAVSPGPAAQPHENRMPVLALNFCIALAGLFPSRG
jgi:microcystin-dependent protein